MAKIKGFFKVCLLAKMFLWTVERTPGQDLYNKTGPSSFPPHERGPPFSQYHFLSTIFLFAFFLNAKINMDFGSSIRDHSSYFHLSTIIPNYSLKGLGESRGREGLKIQKTEGFSSHSQGVASTDHCAGNDDGAIQDPLLLSDR